MKICLSYLFISLSILATDVCSASYYKKLYKNKDNFSDQNSIRNDACSTYSIPLPDALLHTNGRRISELRCMQYIWGLKLQRDVNIRRIECFGKKLGGFGVANGRDAKFGELPHVGAVGWLTTTGEYDFICSCSLISSKFALTAAHCSSIPRQVGLREYKYKEPVIVRLGAKNIKDLKFNDPVDAKIKRIIKHPQYSAPYKYFDIAIIELRYSLGFSSRIYPACIFYKENINELSVAGWGATAKDSKSAELQVAYVDYINSTLCQKYLMANRLMGNGVIDHQICAGKLEGGADTCKGDSGGPLQVNISLPIKSDIPIYNVIGVTSHGHHCGKPNNPGIYTKVSSFIDWIEHIVWKEYTKNTTDEFLVWE